MLEPQFLGDKPFVQNKETINNLVIVDVKPADQQAFRDIVLPEMAESLKVEPGVLAMYAATDAKNRYISVFRIGRGIHRQYARFHLQ